MESGLLGAAGPRIRQGFFTTVDDPTEAGKIMKTWGVLEETNFVISKNSPTQNEQNCRKLLGVNM